MLSTSSPASGRSDRAGLLPGVCVAALGTLLLLLLFCRCSVGTHAVCMGPPAARASAPRLAPITCPGSRCFRHKQGCLPLCGKVCMTLSFQLAFLSTCCLSCSFMACACSLKLLECTILLPCLPGWLCRLPDLCLQVLPWNCQPANSRLLAFLPRYVQVTMLPVLADFLPPFHHF